MYILPQYPFKPPVQQIYSPIVFECINCIIQPSEERGGLYLGDLLATMRVQTLVQYNIGAILSVAIDAKYNKANDPRTQHIVNKHILAHDIYGYDISQHFQQCYEWIDHYLAEKVNVLVHCRAGKSRSASVVIAYMMKKFNMNYENAYSYVKTRRSRTEPNEGFKILLKQYQSKLFAPQSTQLLRRSITGNPQSHRMLDNTKEVMEDVREGKEQNSISPASQDNHLSFESPPHTVPKIGGSFQTNLRTSGAEVHAPSQNQSPGPRKISFDQNSVKPSNFGRQQMVYQQKHFTQQNTPIHPVDRYNRPGIQNIRYQPDIQYKIQPNLLQPNQNMIYYSQAGNRPKTIHELQLQNQIISPPNYNNHLLYQQQPRSFQYPQPSERVAPLPNPQPSSWLDWFSWISHQ